MRIRHAFEPNSNPFAKLSSNLLCCRSRSVHFPPGDDWVDYWSPNSTVYKGGSTAHVQAPLTTLPVFQRHGSVIPQIELDDETVLVLRTHDDGTAHRGTVYEDDGITTNAQLREEFFLLRTQTGYGDEVTLTARVSTRCGGRRGVTFAGRSRDRASRVGSRCTAVARRCHV